MTPEQNLDRLGIESNANNLICAKQDPNIDPKFKAFVGYAEPTEEEMLLRRSMKINVLDEFQIKYAKDCIKKYKLNYEAMFKDTSLNYNQLTANKLKKLCVAYLRQTNQTVDDYLN